MEIKDVEIDKLKFSDYNPRIMTDKEFTDLMNSLKVFDVVEPAVVNKDFSIIGGHMRIRAAKQLGWERFPVYFVDLEPNQAKLLNLALNKIRGGWDDDKLAELMYKLKQVPGLDAELSGFGEDEISILLDKVSNINGEEEFDVEENLPEKAESKRGEIYELGKHRLMCGDSTDSADINKLLGGKEADMVFTDPPYNIDYNYTGKFTKKEDQHLHKGRVKQSEGSIEAFPDNLTPEQYEEFVRAYLTNIEKVTKASAPIYNFSGWSFLYVFEKVFPETGWHFAQPIIWYKNQLVMARMGRDYHSMFEHIIYGWKKGTNHYFNPETTNEVDVWEEKRVPPQKTEHGTQKPVSLVNRALKNSSKRGDIVLDVFGGSGSTLIGCEELDRVCYMMEIDPRYVDVIRKRYEVYKGKSSGNS